jgi:hypothetical protein
VVSPYSELRINQQSLRCTGQQSLLFTVKHVGKARMSIAANNSDCSSALMISMPLMIQVLGSSSYVCCFFRPDNPI